MIYLDNGNIHDPALNLALEEYALRRLPADDDYLLFYINEPSIIIGKNQNTAEEVNESYVKERGIHVVRRLSGGGAVYHDLGNLNFSFITRDDGKSFHNFRKFTEPVVAALRKLGVNAELSGRNDLQVGERKISGNAQFASKGRMFSHGTLLFDSEVEAIVAALNVNPAKFQSKATKSVRSRVANISEFLAEPMTMDAFKRFLLASIFGAGSADGATGDHGSSIGSGSHSSFRADSGDRAGSRDVEDDHVDSRGIDSGGDIAAIPRYPLSEADWDAVRQLADERYRSWDWNYGRSPAFNVRQSKRIEGAGTYDVRLNVEGGVIREAAVYGDFFGTGEVSDFTAKLLGVRYGREAIHAALADVDLTAYFGPVNREEWLSLLIGD